jgi:xanthine/uracil permease
MIGLGTHLNVFPAVLEVAFQTFTKSSLNGLIASKISAIWKNAIFLPKKEAP